MMYKQENIRRVKLDLTGIEIGESIFSKDYSRSVLCIRISQTDWEVWIYENRLLSKIRVSDINSYVTSDNRIFEAEKTTRLVEQWERVRDHLNCIKDFEKSINNNFLW